VLRSVALGVVLLCVGPATIARAYEDQITLGVGAGYAHAFSDRVPRHGALFDVSSSFGLDPEYSVRVRASYAFHPDDSPLHVIGLGGELLYLVDVLEVVPYFGVGAGALGSVRGDADPQLDGELHLALGLDYLLSRSLALELDARPYFIASELDRDPFYFAVAAALVFVFDE
jgi:hypothetical protein